MTDTYTPSGQDPEYNELLERVAMLEHQLTEVCGCVEEYMTMPTLSLKTRMHSAVARAKKRAGL